ncbi:uncharacterized protein EI97DRAFT_482034 [Westerdykella ornata]|uniref:Uncharacterized protein n=1 Tax=Westerdykella ornata TaxID=318751 RepID=A0A6A6JTF6_WESOR|nr:uncharacterized protein EI97DRAFT_482034 [Westerdykella ornata]KAF2279524.1 hypothetical protein EI97DRAFT_482034 [Westerdykella ornata]
MADAAEQDATLHYDLEEEGRYFGNDATEYLSFLGPWEESAGQPHPTYSEHDVDTFDAEPTSLPPMTNRDTGHPPDRHVPEWHTSDESFLPALRQEPAPPEPTFVPRPASQNINTLLTLSRVSHPTAGDLLRNDSRKVDRKRQIPWGLQRILTHMEVEDLAALSQVPVPFPTDEEVAQYFRSQKEKPMHPFISHSTPANVDICLLGRIRITAAEIMAFFPNHIEWNDAIFRLVQNSWTRREIAGYINYVRQLPSSAAVTRERISHWARMADRQIMVGSPINAHRRPGFKTVFFTPEKWELPKLSRLEADPIDYFLVDLAEGVVNWPTGSGARLLTRAIRLAQQQGHRYVKLSQIHEFMRVHKVHLPLLRPMAIRGKCGGVNPDVLVKRGLELVIYQDIVQVGLAW